MMTTTVRAPGPFRLHKAEQARPSREHKTFERAEAEAQRLVTVYPDCCFVIVQEVARVSANG